MASENLKVVIGLLAVVFAVFILMTALFYPTSSTTCISGTGIIGEKCTTDTDIRATIAVFIVMGIAVIIGAGGIRTAWKNW